MGTITDFQRRMWIVLSYLTLCKYYIVRDNAGNFIIKNTGTIRRLFYYTLWINGVIKISYLTMAYRHYLPVEVTFLDQIHGHVGLVSHVLTIDPGDKHVVPEVSHVRDSLCELENPGNGISSTRLPKACGRCYFEE